MIKRLRSQWLRTKRLPLRWLTLACPILFASLFSFYLQASSLLSGIEVTSFFISFSILSCFAISILVPMLYEPDREACHYANDLRVGVNRTQLFFSKFLLLNMLVLTILVTASSLFLLFLCVMGRAFDIQLVGAFILICWITLLPLTILYQISSLIWGLTGSVLLGGFITLASLLLGTTDLGALLWPYLPFIWSVKLPFALAKNQLNFLSISPFLIYDIALAVVLLLLATRWYNKWEGQTRLEE